MFFFPASKREDEPLFQHAQICPRSFLAEKAVVRSSIPKVVRLHLFLRPVSSRVAKVDDY